MSQVHALMMILLVLSLVSNLVVLVKVKMMYKEQSKMRDTLIQMQSSLMTGGRMDPRLMAPRPGGQMAPKVPAPAPTK